MPGFWISRVVVAVVLAGASIAGGAAAGAVPQARTHGPELGIDISINHNFTHDELNAYAPSGGAWVRIDADWSFIQKNGEAQSNWTDTDEMVTDAEQHGLRVLMVPTYTPAWAAPPGCYTAHNTSGHCAPADPQDYANFVALAAARYSPGGGAGTNVTAWEVWNEENGFGFGGHADPKVYTEMLQLAFGEIRAVNPTADVLVGGLAATPGGNGRMAAAQFLRRIYHDGARGSFTGVADHPYPGTSEPLVAAKNNAFERAPQLHRIMQKEGDGTLKVWATEIGYSSSTKKYGVGLDGQATRLGEAIRQWFKWKWTGPLFVYNLRDLTTTDTSKFSTTGLFNCDYSPKPAWNAFVTLAGGAAGNPPLMDCQT